MAASTIEELRSLPGRPAADIDDPLARRLSVLNVRRLFASDVSPWTTTVTVKRGDSASRIAREHGSTLASLEKLNGGNCDRLVVGRRLKVLNHPRFSLAVHRVTRTADLSLNGKFFKRYYLTGPVRGAVGAYETPERLHRLWAEKGISFKAADGAELEMLLPKGTPVFVAEF
jgi:LysM repeat protein